MDQRLLTPWLARAAWPLDWHAAARPGFAPLPPAILDRPIAVLFAEQAQAHGEAVVLDDGQTRLTYAELLTRVQGLAPESPP